MRDSSGVQEIDNEVAVLLFDQAFQLLLYRLALENGANVVPNVTTIISPICSYSSGTACGFDMPMDSRRSTIQPIIISSQM